MTQRLTFVAFDSPPLMSLIYSCLFTHVCYSCLSYPYLLLVCVSLTHVFHFLHMSDSCLFYSCLIYSCHFSFKSFIHVFIHLFAHFSFLLKFLLLMVSFSSCLSYSSPFYSCLSTLCLFCQNLLYSCL